MTPTIGITRCSKLEDYVTSVERAGGRVRVLEVSDSPRKVIGEIQGLLLTGGGDIDPVFYGEERHASVEDAEPGRDEFELDLARRAVDADVPVLGICRGAQVLNVSMGGSLVQDIPSGIQTDLRHSVREPKNHVAHDVRVTEGTRLHETLGTAVSSAGLCCVNSRHHQSVGRLGRGLIAAAVAEDGIVEAIEAPDATFCVGVQWHPENFCAGGEFSALFEAFVASARRRPASRREAYSETNRTRED